MSVLEIVDVAPVGGGILLGGLAVEQLADSGVLAERVGPERKQVEAGRADADAEVQRFDGTLLTQDLVKVLEFGGGSESQRTRIAAAFERAWRQRP